MKKEQLEKSNKCVPDLFEWIKYFLQDKISHQKVQDDYNDDKETAEAKNLKYFDRKLYQLKIMTSTTHDELQKVTREIVNNGIKAHGTFSIPLLNFYEYIITVKRLKSFRDIDTNLINTYIEIKLTDKKEWTQKNYYNQIKSLFKFVDKYSISDDNFIFDIGITAAGKRVKSPVKNIPSKLLKFLEPNEFVDFVASFKSYTNNHPNNAQPKLLMKVLSFTGLRVTELRNIRIDEVDTQYIDKEKHLRIKISNKKNIDGYVFILYKLIAKEYKSELFYRQEHKIKTPYLFYTRDFTPYAEKSLYDLIKRYLKNAKLTKPVDGHGLRRSYATYMLSKGVSRERISTLLKYTYRDLLDFYVFTSDKSYENVKNIFDVI